MPSQIPSRNQCSGPVLGGKDKAATDNHARQFEAEAAHLPGRLSEAIAYHRQQIIDHNAAMLACDFDQAFAIRTEAKLLARKLNGGDPGIRAHDEAPGYVLARECAAPAGEVPLWGQDGSFELPDAKLNVRVTMHGMFGIGATSTTYLGFDVRAIDRTKPFLSGTGYRSFLGCSLPPEDGLTVDRFVSRIIEHHIATELRGKLLPVRDRDWT